MLNGGVAPRAADVPGRGVAGLVEVEHVDEAVVLVAVHPLRMVERLVEDPHRLDVRVGRQVLVAEHEHLVLPEVLAQALGRRVVDAAGQVDADDLGAEHRAGGAGFVESVSAIVISVPPMGRGGSGLNSTTLVDNTAIRLPSIAYVAG